MSESASPLEEVSSRLNQIESVLMHLQHDVEQLNTAILHQNDVLDKLSRSMKLLDNRIGMLEDEDEGRDPLQEKPPHY
ncbi:SlyX family protein [Gimesia chilikensis]|uniref:Protein SlyX n=1 Tax=Gimesia chilikensis TaxID=2605989 RepID=A0A517WMZ3_9PLAN|nr:SlyX family protein [Gimesia chilikensis]QDU06629.1 Protein SlyX [Gimesia chilikensis]